MDYKFICEICGEWVISSNNTCKCPNGHGLMKREVYIPKKRKNKFEPTSKNCTIEIFPIGETEKAYILENGSNGKISKGNTKEYYSYVAKSICYKSQDGKIYKPIWA